MADHVPVDEERIYMMLQMHSLNGIDYLRSGLLIAMFVGAMMVEPCSRACFWLKADSIASAVLGICCYFFPKGVLDYIALAQIDKVHMQLMQAIGATLVGISITRFSSNCSYDYNVRLALLTSNLVGGVILIHTLLAGHYRYFVRVQRLSDQHISFVVLGSVLWTVGNFIVLMTLPGIGSGHSNRLQSSAVGPHILYDVIAKLPVTFCCYGFPDHAFRYMNLGDFKPDGVHAHLLRIIATLLIMIAFYGLNSLHFTHEFDRRAYFLGHIVAFFMFLPITQLHQWMYRQANTHVFVYHFFIIGVYHINCVIGYFVQREIPQQMWRHTGEHGH